MVNYNELKMNVNRKATVSNTSKQIAIKPMLLRKSSIQLNDNDTSFIKKNAFNASCFTNEDENKDDGCKLPPISKN